MAYYVLVRNYGSEGLVVCGLTGDEYVADIWRSASSETDYVVTEMDKTDSLGLSPQSVKDREANQ